MAYHEDGQDDLARMQRERLKAFDPAMVSDLDAHLKA